MNGVTTLASLTTAAGYSTSTGEAVQFWERMAAVSARRGGSPPEILSDHPSDQRRIQQLRQWAGYAQAAKKAYDEGRVAPEAR